jgi:hypothetical protein
LISLEVLSTFEVFLFTPRFSEVCEDSKQLSKPFQTVLAEAVEAADDVSGEREAFSFVSAGHCQDQIYRRNDSPDSVI